MKKQLLSVRDVVAITGVTVRTLHYYDRIGLFKPSRVTEAGYRLYAQRSLAQLQTILFLKEMDFSLKAIKDIMKLPESKQKQLLEQHIQTLQAKKDKLETMMSAIQLYVSGEALLQLPIFEQSAVLPLQEQYANEAALVYAQTAGYQSFKHQIEQLSEADKARQFSAFEHHIQDLFRRMAACMDKAPSSDQMQRLVVEWKERMGQFMICDDEMLACLAHTYVEDSRFKAYINAYSEGDLATFLYKAIMHHIGRNG